MHFCFLIIVYQMVNILHCSIAIFCLINSAKLFEISPCVGDILPQCEPEFAFVLIK